LYQDYYTTSLHTLKTKLLGLRTPWLVSVHSFGPQFQSAVFDRGARAKPLGGDEARAAACLGGHSIKGSGALGGAPRHPRRRPRRSGNPKLKSGVPRAVRGAGAQANEWGWSPRSNAFRAPFNQVQGSGGRVALQSAAAPLPRRDTHAEILNSKEDPRENLWGWRAQQAAESSAECALRQGGSSALIFPGSAAIFPGIHSQWSEWWPTSRGSPSPSSNPRSVF